MRLSPEQKNHIAVEIYRQTDGALGFGDRDAVKIIQIYEDERPSCTLGQISLIDAFVALRNADGFKYIGPQNQTALQDYMIVVMDFFAREDGMVNGVQNHGEALTTKHQISPSLIKAAELIATRAFLRSFLPSSSPRS